MLEFLERISPLKVENLKRITKPLAIAHGDKDTRVPLREALAMWKGVKANGGIGELIVCEEEGHGTFDFGPGSLGGLVGTLLIGHLALGRLQTEERD